MAAKRCFAGKWFTWPALACYPTRMAASQPHRTKDRATRAGKPRRSGRPDHPRNAVGREAIIAATRDLLKLKPPSALSRIEIARFAGIDSSLIRYYFGTKDALLTAVATEISTE